MKTDALVYIANDGTVTFPDDLEVLGVGGSGDEPSAYRLTSPRTVTVVRIERGATVTMPDSVTNLFDAVTAFVASR